MAASITKPLTINVGKLGTKPVSRYVSKTGRNNKAEIAASINEAQPKKPNGL